MMDRHHHSMVDLCGAISERSMGRGGGTPAGDLFLELVRLTSMHFGAEEELMRRSDYPGRMDHQDRHHELSRLLKYWETRALRRELTLNAAFLQHLNQWLENHILGSDRGFSRFLLGQEGADPTDRRAGRRPCSVRKAAVSFQAVARDCYAQAQPSRRFFHRSVAGLEHF